MNDKLKRSVSESNSCHGLIELMDGWEENSTGHEEMVIDVANYIEATNDIPSIGENYGVYKVDWVCKGYESGAPEVIISLKIE